MKRLIIATRNAHKTDEIRAMLGDLFDEVTDLNAFPEIPSPVEDGVSFAANARIKSESASEALGGAMVMSDDSGLEVDALGGAPGVFSARYAGEGASDADNRAKLLAALAKSGARGKARAGRFRCVLSIAKDGAEIAAFDGAVEGILANEEKGGGGFGYDPLFIPEGHCETFGQLPAEVKNGLSHRARALAQARVHLEQVSAVA
ncbi:MAG: RdgB/HAM1 family non-canonical purine NTP pyrophosphatase [Verrucomicrobiales bacterium]